MKCLYRYHHRYIQRRGLRGLRGLKFKAAGGMDRGDYVEVCEGLVD
ncbi:hypothetical protein CLOSTASPAR_02735 [[Clostridium] asparagiforme DSM 15981]|uniref:Uncharacterized protein n=1 Tax=[Clostridium] asparagiforme DSM 15981 TaxID=518636 RepID=C0D0E9_9FIRM|nr:hypothetical protein CLOSTASPAR_02735 [[Clostridium] asparagiforme DSM 15981]